MASIIQGATTGLKYLVLTGQLNFSAAQTYKIALYTDAADLSPGNTNVAYSTTNEVVGAGYTAGGNDLVVADPGFSFEPVVGYVSFGNTSWPSSTFTARGAVIYRNTGGDGRKFTVAVLDFGSNVTSDNSTFNVTFPPTNATEALIRFE
tara:strand:+ start:239 stop:685 length:447 start_codon:yes stop_codon:yes gene_type:complete